MHSSAPPCTQATVLSSVRCGHSMPYFKKISDEAVAVIPLFFRCYECPLTSTELETMLLRHLTNDCLREFRHLRHHRNWSSARSITSITVMSSSYLPIAQLPLLVAASLLRSARYSVYLGQSMHSLSISPTQHAPQHAPQHGP